MTAIQSKNDINRELKRLPTVLEKEKANLSNQRQRVEEVIGNNEKLMDELEMKEKEADDKDFEIQQIAKTIDEENQQAEIYKKERQHYEDRKSEVLKEITALQQENKRRLAALEHHVELDDTVREAIEARNMRFCSQRQETARLMNREIEKGETAKAGSGVEGIQTTEGRPSSELDKILVNQYKTEDNRTNYYHQRS